MTLPSDIFQSLHVLLISEDDSRGKALAKALRDQRASVGDVQRSAREPNAPRGADLVVMDARYEARNAEQLASLRRDVRARWASIVTIDFEKLVKSDGSVLLGGLTEQVAPLVDADRKLTQRAREQTVFSTRLEPLGPSRTLRALSLSGHTLHVELKHPTLEAAIELSNELLVSASAERGQHRWEAWSALVRILGLSEAEVVVARRAFTAAMNIMEPVDQALEVAAQERLCAADQIAVEEAEAQAKHRAQPKLPPAPVPIDARPTAPAPAPTAPPPAPSLPMPRMPTRPQRTLIGVAPGLPATNPVAAPKPPVPNPAQAKPPLPPLAPNKPPVPPVMEAPRYAHRPGQGTGSKASMTLIGVAPGALPGVSEARAQLSQTRPDAELTEVALQRQQPANTDFADPPTVRLNLEELATLGDELPELADDLARSAAPLSTPLPPAPSVDEEAEPGQGFDDSEDPLEQTSIAPSTLTRQLLEQAVQDALTEGADSGGAKPIRATRHRLESGDPPPPEASTSLEFAHDPKPEASPGIEETLVVQRAPQPSSSRMRVLLLGLVFVSLAAVLAVMLLRERGIDPVAALRDIEPFSRLLAAPGAAPAPSAPQEPASAAAPVQPANGAEPSAPQAEGENVAATGVAQPAEISDAGAAQPAAAEAPNAPTGAELAPEPAAARDNPAVAQAEAQPVKTPAGAEANPSAPAAGTQPAPGEALEPTARDNAPGAAADAGAQLTKAQEADALLRKGQRLLMSGDAEGARSALEQSLALDASSPHLRATLAETLLKLDEAAGALTHAQAAVRLRPKRARYHVLLGDVFARLGKDPQAQAAWQKALEVDPNDAEATQRLAGSQ